VLYFLSSARLQPLLAYGGSNRPVVVQANSAEGGRRRAKERSINKKQGATLGSFLSCSFFNLPISSAHRVHSQSAHRSAHKPHKNPI